jgi:hypothetical protein
MRKMQLFIGMLALVTALHAYCFTAVTHWRMDYMKESSNCAALAILSR